MKKTTVFVIPFMLPWNWSADYQRQTCLELAKHHEVVAYMQRDSIFFLKAPFCHVQYPTCKHVRFCRPLYLLPFRRIRWVEELNQAICYRLFELSLGISHGIVLWIFDPIFEKFVKVTQGCSLYDCVDYIWDINSKRSAELQELEEKLIRRVKYFFVNSYTLAALHEKIRLPTAVVPQGFRFHDFTRVFKSQTVVFSKKKPIIGYVGAVDHRLDFHLLTELIGRNQQWQFIFWGPVQEMGTEDAAVRNKVEELQKYENVIFDRSIDLQEIPGIIAQFSVGIIPYDISSDSNRYCFPMKIFEYFYMGKAVVAAPIQELKRYQKFVYIASGVGGWEKSITSVLSHRPSERDKHEQRALAIQNNWEKKVRIIQSIIAL